MVYLMIISFFIFYYVCYDSETENTSATRSAAVSAGDHDDGGSMPGMFMGAEGVQIFFRKIRVVFFRGKGV